MGCGLMGWGETFGTRVDAESSAHSVQIFASSPQGAERRGLCGDVCRNTDRKPGDESRSQALAERSAMWRCLPTEWKSSACQDAQNVRETSAMFFTDSTFVSTCFNTDKKILKALENEKVWQRQCECWREIDQMQENEWADPWNSFCKTVECKP